jgi:hypothetical protein
VKNQHFYQLSITRSQLGLITKAWQICPSGPLVLGQVQLAYTVCKKLAMPCILFICTLYNSLQFYKNELRCTLKSTTQCCSVKSMLHAMSYTQKYVTHNVVHTVKSMLLTMLYTRMYVTHNIVQSKVCYSQCCTVKSMLHNVV